MTVETDVLLARDIKAARRQVKGCITVLDDVRRRHPEMKRELNAMLAQLRSNRASLTDALNEAMGRLRARLPAPKAVHHG